MTQTLPEASDVMTDSDKALVERLNDWACGGWTSTEGLPALLAEAASTISRLTGERDEAKAALAVCQESLKDQAAARQDPLMPILLPDVLEQLEADADANYAMAMSLDERRAAHGLSLLCAWQRNAAAGITPPSEGE